MGTIIAANFARALRMRRQNCANDATMCTQNVRRQKHCVHHKHSWNYVISVMPFLLHGCPLKLQSFFSSSLLHSFKFNIEMLACKMYVVCTFCIEVEILRLSIMNTFMSLRNEFLIWVFEYFSNLQKNKQYE